MCMSIPEFTLTFGPLSGEGFCIHSILHSCDTRQHFDMMGWMQVLVVLSGNSDSVAILLNARTGILNHVQQIPQRITRIHSIGRGHYDHCGYFMSDATIPFPKTMTVHMFPNHVEMYRQRATLWVPDKETGAPSVPLGSGLVLPR